MPGFGPSIAGIIMTYRTQDREGRRCPAPTHRGLSYAQKKRTLPGKLQPKPCQPGSLTIDMVHRTGLLTPLL